MSGVDGKVSWNRKECKEQLGLWRPQQSANHLLPKSPKPETGVNLQRTGKKAPGRALPRNRWINSSCLCPLQESYGVDMEAGDYARAIHNEGAYPPFCSQRGKLSWGLEDAVVLHR